jgi:hypothetical protein
MVFSLERFFYLLGVILKAPWVASMSILRLDNRR